MLDSSEEVKKLDLFLLLMSKFVFIQKEQAVKKCVRRRRHQNVVSHSYSGKMSSFLCIFLYSNSMVKYIKMTELFFLMGTDVTILAHTRSSLFFLQFAIILKTLMMSYSRIYQLDPICSTLIMKQEENYNNKIRSFSIGSNHHDDDGMALMLMWRTFFSHKIYEWKFVIQKKKLINFFLVTNFPIKLYTKWASPTSFSSPRNCSTFSLCKKRKLRSIDS